MKTKPEYIEGPESWSRFNSAMKTALSVPRAEMQRRLAVEKEQAAKNPNRRGPKPKAKRIA